MPLPCPGPAPISFLDIQNEFGGSNPIGLNEYYRNGGLIPSNNTSVPTSGSISLDNFFCAVNEIIVYITSNSENVNVQSLFGGNWTQNVPKRLIINGGVVVGSLDPGAYALTIPSGLVSTLRIDNNGSIQGAGGSPNSGDGGPAILANAAVTIDNIGSIYGGGGGGGFGGTGGDGLYIWGDESTVPDGVTPPQQFVPSPGGGSGGNGGQGQGYAQNATGGSGGAPGSTDCQVLCFSEGISGAGGTGGTGGSFGNNGGTGQTGASGNGTGGYPGDPGGLAGCYITNNGNVTWVNTGDRRGRVC